MHIIKIANSFNDGKHIKIRHATNGQNKLFPVRKWFDRKGEHVALSGVNGALGTGYCKLATAIRVCVEVRL